jgi:uracil phosphoribosyltransferase
MLATGGSVCKTIELLRISGVKPENITFINLVGCEEGIARVMKEHDGVKIITAAVDPELNH